MKTCLLESAPFTQAMWLCALVALLRLRRNSCEGRGHILYSFRVYAIELAPSWSQAVTILFVVIGIHQICFLVGFNDLPCRLLKRGEPGGGRGPGGRPSIPPTLSFKVHRFGQMVGEWRMNAMLKLTD